MLELSIWVVHQSRVLSWYPPNIRLRNIIFNQKETHNFENTKYDKLLAADLLTFQ